MYHKIEPEWTPSPDDIAWVEGLLRMLKDDGVWVCPCSMSIFTFDKTKKEYVLEGDPQDTTNRKTIRILKDRGWKEKGPCAT